MLQYFDLSLLLLIIIFWNTYFKTLYTYTFYSTFNIIILESINGGSWLRLLQLLPTVLWGRIQHLGAWDLSYPIHLSPPRHHSPGRPRQTNHLLHGIRPYPSALQLSTLWFRAIQWPHRRKSNRQETCELHRGLRDSLQWRILRNLQQWLLGHPKLLWPYPLLFLLEQLHFKSNLRFHQSRTIS